MIPPTYPCADVPEVPEGQYGRLCPSTSGHWAPHDESQLAILAQKMRAPDPVVKGVEPRHVMRSGYVYLGQFIDHDITRDISLLDEAGPDTDRTQNYRTPCLDLDLLYGKDPATVPCLYHDGGKLKLGSTLDSGNEKGSPDNDLFRRPDGTAVVVDARSDENLIIAQLHVLFAKFHNKVLDLLATNPALSPGPVRASLFEQARRFVTWHYQWIVLNDFLPSFIQRATLDDIETNGLYLYPRAYTPADYPMAVPVEFSVAAFRFGHSMVRPSYMNRPHEFIDAAVLIMMTKKGEGITSELPANFTIDWSRFFTEPQRVNRGEIIDTFITPALYDLPPMAVQAFRRQQLGVSASRSIYRDKMIPPLPELTLRRGSRVRLPSGEEFANRFGYTPLSADLIPAQHGDADFFQQPGFKNRTPLWYYILREAVVEGVTEPEKGNEHWNIQKLGTIGGRIVAETMHQLLNADYKSIRHAGKNWRPPQFVFGDLPDLRAIETMQDLVSFVTGLPAKGIDAPHRSPVNVIAQNVA